MTSDVTFVWCYWFVSKIFTSGYDHDCFINFWNKYSPLGDGNLIGRLLGLYFFSVSQPLAKNIFMEQIIYDTILILKQFDQTLF